MADLERIKAGSVAYFRALESKIHLLGDRNGLPLDQQPGRCTRPRQALRGQVTASAPDTATSSSAGARAGFRDRQRQQHGFATTLPLWL
ncbi:hypothetical protein SAV14893_085440 [Streptomyces avermitilis]|uniref:Uncharacterized protein n=1 Tax=Streptomyces avermitilis TaxID=33903 RepID=A0A4D4N785_STRAX|nr:hypothetical protein SAVMC3_11180 [Streptomyces avermitilis]GDY69151.1 hypothetical protein SAV14893_085440 [Streptomyces avermitilis]GDY79399.1 hypothetical protein SAV31267_088840 [Streptomyces avermitilis]GDY88360.1 hypothetical protein SAVCW2_75590 [Streptomyces avermitilis]